MTGILLGHPADISTYTKYAPIHYSAILEHLLYKQKRAIAWQCTDPDCLVTRFAMFLVQSYSMGKGVEEITI